MIDSMDIGCTDSQDTAADDNNDYDGDDLDIDLSAFDFDSDEEAADGSFFAEESGDSLSEITDDSQLSLFDQMAASEYSFDALFETGEEADEETIDEEDEEDIDEEEDISEEDDGALDGQWTMDQYQEYLEDMKHVPALDSELGHWLGERGNSEFVANEGTEAARILNAIGRQGLEYHEGKVDMKPVIFGYGLLSREDMETMTDVQQKDMICRTIAEDILESMPEDDEELEEDDEELEEDDEELEEDDEELEEDDEELEYESDINWDVVKAMYSDDDVEDVDVLAYLMDGKAPPGWDFTHDGMDEGGDVIGGLAPAAIHRLFTHRGYRSKTGTKRR